MKNNYSTMAEQIIAKAGGKGNIISAAHCATRLRLIVKDREVISDDDMETVEGVKGVFFTSGQYQIILGTGVVNHVCKEANKLLGNDVSTEDAASKNQNVNSETENNDGLIKRLVRILGDIFIPIIPALVATGLFLGLKGVMFNPTFLELVGISPENIPTYLTTVVSVLTETSFAFLPALVCWSAFRVFGGSPVLGIVLGLMLVSPALPNAYAIADPNSGVTPIYAFGIIPLVGYQGSIIPALVTGFIGASIEKALRKNMPSFLDFVCTPFLTLLIALLMGLFIVGPVFHTVEQQLLVIGEFVLDLPFGIGGFIIGFFWMFIVVTGVHHVFNLLEISLLAATGFNPFNAIISMAAVAQGAACLAVALKAKKKNIREIGPASAFSCWLGICEPAIFGVNMRYSLRPMVVASLVSGVAGLVSILIGLQGTANGVTGIPGLLLYIYDTNQLMMYVGLSIATGVAAFAATWAFGVPKEVMEEKNNKQTA